MDLNRILLNIVPFLSLFTLLGWLAWLWFERQASLASMRAKTRNAFYNQLLERLSTANEFIEFLESEKGRELMRDLAPERTDAHRRVLKTTRNGIMALCVGVVLIVVGLLLGPVHTAVTVWGAVAAGCGAGFLLSARISYKLALQWGLIQSHEAGKTAP